MSFCKVTLLLLSPRVGVYFPSCWVWAGLWLALISGRWWECHCVTSQSQAFTVLATSRVFVVVILLETWDQYAIKKSQLGFCRKITKSCPTLCDPMDCIAHQGPLSMGFSRQEYWSGVPFPPPGDLPDIGIESASPALAVGFFITELPRKPHLWAVNHPLECACHRRPIYSLWGFPYHFMNQKEKKKTATVCSSWKQNEML